jgi:ATP-dependent Clp protease ATP-binding subunit ClpA
MTSNVGSDYINKMQTIGFDTKEEMQKREGMKEKIMDSLKDQFRPEFLNRIDEIVIFNYLQKDQIKKIVELELEKVEKRLRAKNVSLQISEKAKSLIAERGFDQNLGARPLKRVIQREILDPLSLKLVANEIREGNNVIIDEKAGKIVFELPALVMKMEKKTRKLAKAGK